ncbi:MAG: plasmid pRiA4b ORF-3 family protein [Bacteroidia bacterium]
MNSIIQVKITLENIKPLIWRRLLISSCTTFYELHHILQIAFGWKNHHLFQFKIEDYYIGIPDPDYDIGGVIKMIDAKDVVMDKILTEKGYEITYEYDFGNNWKHTIIVEKFLNVEPGICSPSCMAGKRAAPPEDCGGVKGYYSIMETIIDKNHKEYKRLMGNRAFNPEYFNIDRVNNQLARLDSYIKKIESSSK